MRARVAWLCAVNDSLIEGVLVMSVSVIVYLYEDGELIEGSLVDFDSARQCADWLRSSGLCAPSCHPGPYDEHTSLSRVDMTVNPRTGLAEPEYSVHPVFGMHPRVWAAIVASVSREWTHYTGPYYVEG